MKRVLTAGAVCVVALAVAGSAAAVVLPRGPVNAVQGERIPGVLVVNFKPGVRPATKMQGATGGAVTGIASVDGLSARYGLRDHRPLFPGAERVAAVAGAPDLGGYYVLDFDPAVDLDRAAADYLGDPNVGSVEYDFYAYIMRTPDDPQFSAMRNLENGGDYDIDAPEAWERTVGSPNVVLADTDTGVLYTHEDLVDNIWVNPGEDLDGDGQVWDVGDINGIDDDGNGYVDDLIGWDFVSSGSYVWPGEDGSVQDNDPSDFNGHGTHTSGTIAATTNNAIGVSGVAGGFGPGIEDGCKIMCLRMGYSFDDDGYENGRTHMSYVAQAFRYAADNGAVAINYSFGSSEGGGIETATDYAIAHGLVISASAGNESSTYFGYLQSRPDVMCVASTTSLDAKSSFSNYGVEVDVSAPGSSIRSTVSNHYLPGYAIYSGTSMAAPHVVGLVGLIKSLNPLLTGTEVFERIVNTTDDIDALNPAYAGLLGSGRINAASALANIASTGFTGSPIIGDAPLTVDFADVSETPPTAWVWDFGDGDSSFVQHPTHTFGPGLHDVSLQTETE
ncbi:MAG TPA: S8 family serine peptidase, partial [Acidobacteriota bacterium]|nr:S8 family serine peptidase [Acidobacteriota bacterium]